MLIASSSTYIILLAQLKAEFIKILELVSSMEKVVI